MESPTKKIFLGEFDEMNIDGDDMLITPEGAKTMKAASSQNAVGDITSFDLITLKTTI